MNVLGLDGKTYRLKYGKVRENCSSGHKRARELIKELFPFYPFYEESYVDGGKTKMYLDFFNPKLKLIIEVDGVQHKTFSPFYHGTLANFRKEKNRDQQKEQWANLNGFNIIRLPDGDTDDEWRQTIRNYTIRDCREHPERVGNQTGDLPSESSE